MPRDSLGGRWSLDVSASRLPFPAPRSVEVQIAADEEAITLTERSVAADGAAETVLIRARLDDEVYPVFGSALADGFAIRRAGPRTWRTRGIKEGEVAFTATIALAPDGSRFVEETVTTLADGTRAPATLVYVRAG